MGILIGALFLITLTTAFGIYVLRARVCPPSIKPVVYFLVFTVLVEIIGCYPLVAYYTKYSFLPFIKDTVFMRNFWWYNIYSIVSTVFYGWYFSKQISSNNVTRIAHWVLVAFTVTAIIFLVITPVFFVAYSPFTVIGGAILLILIIALYYWDILHSDKILKIKALFPFYVSVGILVHQICNTPLFIYSTFLNEAQNPLFVNLHKAVIFGTNVILYSLLIIGFYRCSSKKK